MARLELIVDASQAARGFRQAEQGSDRYQRSARETIRRNQRLRDSFSRMRENVFNLRNAMIGLAGAGAMGAVIQRTLQSTAAISEQADVAGISVEKFQELTKAFSDMAGVQESITSGALRRFNRRFGLAQEGMGAANNTLERLNISLEQGTGPALEEAITKLANMENGANRTAEASQLFGEDAGPRLAAALAQGGDALDETIEKLREQGRIMSGESVEAARDFNDRFNELKDTLTTNFARAIAENASSLEALGEAIINAGSAAINFGGEVVKFTRFLAEETAAAINGIASDDLVRLDARLNEVRDTIDRLQDAPQGYRNDARIQALKVEEERLSRLVELERERRAESASEQVAKASTDGAGQTQIDILGEVNKQLAFMEQQAERTKKEVEGVHGFLPQQRSAIGIAMENLPEGRSRGGGNFGFEEQSQSAISVALDNLRDANDEASKLDRTVDELGFTFSSAFEDAIIEGQNLRGVIQGLGEDIARIILRQSVTKPLGNALASSIGSAFGGSVAQSADGNVFTGPSMTTVSERGHPEAVLPLERQNGKLGVRASGGSEGGGQTIVNVRNESGGQAEVSRRSSGRDQIVDILIPAVQSGIQSGRLDGPMRERFGITPGTRGR